MKRESFGKRLLKLMKEGETQQQFGDRVGINRNTIATYLKEGNEDRKPDTDILLRISSACHVSVDWLLGLRDTPNSDPKIQEVCEYTHLSEQAVETLHRIEFAGGFFTSEDEESIEMHSMIDTLLSTPDGHFLLLNMCQYLTSNTENFYIDDQPISPDRISFEGGPIGGLIPLSKTVFDGLFMNEVQKALKVLKHKCFERNSED